MAGAVATYMPVYVADILVDTMHLSAEQFGAYSRLLFHMWRQDGYLQRKDGVLMRMAGVEDTDTWSRIWAGIGPLFTDAEGDRLTQKRLLTELGKSKARQEASSLNGVRGGRPRKPSHNLDESQTKPRNNLGVSSRLTKTEPRPNLDESSSTSTSTSTSTRREETYTVSFVAFWNLYPRKAGKGDAWKAWQAAAKQVGTEAGLLTACAETLRWQSASHDWLKEGGKYVPHPATWLNRRRWEDEKPTATRDVRIGHVRALDPSEYPEGEQAI